MQGIRITFKCIVVLSGLGSCSAFLPTSTVYPSLAPEVWGSRVLQATTPSRPCEVTTKIRAQDTGTAGSASGFKVFFDVAAGEQPLGRLVFGVQEGILPKTVENFRTLVTGERASLDSKLRYKGLEFEYSPLYVEGPTYKWSHVCKGPGKNAFGNGREAFKETPEDLGACRHTCPGSAGKYYGLQYSLLSTDGIQGNESPQIQDLAIELQKPLGMVLEELDSGCGVIVAEVNPEGSAAKSLKVLPGDLIVAVGTDAVEDEGLERVMALIQGGPESIHLSLRRETSAPGNTCDTVLAVPIGGPGSGFSRFDIIRVGDSPPQWGERILVNSAVIGSLQSGR